MKRLLILCAAISIITSTSTPSYAAYEDRKVNDYVAENEAIAYDDGYDDGYEDGYEDGHNEGMSEGSKAGYDEGYDDGHYEGMNEGHETGYEEGESEGYESGYQEGYEEGESHMRFIQKQNNSATNRLILFGAVVIFIIYLFEKKKSE